MLRIFLPLYLLLFVFSFFSSDLVEKILLISAPEALIDDTVSDLSGAFYMIEEILRLTPEGQWQEKLSKMSSPNIPVKLVLKSDFIFTKEINDILTKGGIWIADLENDIALKYFDSEHLIQIGPIDTSDLYDKSLLLAFFGGSGTLVICVVLWSLTLQRRIRHLKRATQKLGEGILSIRASESGNMKISDLNHNFNTMAERIQQLIEGHKHLTNAVSHELRTPISRIKFELDYAQDLEDTQKLRHSLNSIAEDINELEELVSEALTYARYDRSELILEYESLPIDIWLHEWIKKTKMPQERATLRLNLIDQTQELDFNRIMENNTQALVVKFHPFSIKRALDNLVLNATRYAESRIEVSWKIQDGFISIWVDDDGPGVPEMDRDNIFSPFIRGDKSRSKLTGGFGLGLAIVKQIMLRHNGTVEVQDSPLGGARFKLCWPL
ncbi:hypothetical protein ATY35_20175 [Vibrio cidicii]|uniref:histidine kinase n=2 Tax=Vibrio cidicii TaxID=1763883 RepID=A0ABR5VWR0_9VIBR|nr:ATP-binding protein [Vibrio cidicii]KYN80612.1 hypothetical protein ATY35_20175 [Vibrio cidicii]MBG0761797.1 hypothetical protein [Vibrio cidicii]